MLLYWIEQREATIKIIKIYGEAKERYELF